MMHRLVVVALALCISSLEANLSCKNLEGKNVDWFMAYKLPASTKDGNKGYGFLYVDGHNPNWTLSSEPVSSPKSAIGATISQVYGNNKDLFYTMYNDEAPHSSKTEGYRGHIKGVLGFDSSTGFWIQHSMPNFPYDPKVDAYGYPETATKFGQTLICFTMRTSDLNLIAEQLRYMMIDSYAQNIPDDFKEKYDLLYPVIVSRTSLNTRKDKQTYNIAQLKSAGGYPFTSFAKHKSFNADLWLDLISKEEQVPLSVESWLNGAAKDLESSCSPEETVLDISSVNINDNTFKSSMDHSKWGISDTAKKPLVCVGDINRQASQTKRGGGALCILDAKIWNSWSKIIDSKSPC